MDEAIKIGEMLRAEIERLGIGYEAGLGYAVIVKGSTVKVITDGHAAVVVTWLGGVRWIVAYELGGKWNVSEGVDDSVEDGDKVGVSMLAHMAFTDVVVDG